jgi:16S rRNA processing protein RimM
MAQIPTDKVLVGRILKPYGLLGEVKVKPETFDFERHGRLKKVHCRDRQGEFETLNVASSRADGHFWYLKFENLRTPESAAHLSGRELLVDPEERLALPENMVYFSDMPGLAVVDEKGERVGHIAEIQEAGSQEYLVVRTANGDVPVPWNDHFVRRVDLAAKTVELDLSTLRGVLF